MTPDNRKELDEFLAKEVKPLTTIGAGNHHRPYRPYRQREIQQETVGKTCSRRQRLRRRQRHRPETDLLGRQRPETADPRNQVLREQDEAQAAHRMLGPEPSRHGGSGRPMHAETGETGSKAGSQTGSPANRKRSRKPNRKRSRNPKPHLSSKKPCFGRAFFMYPNAMNLQRMICRHRH